MGCYEFPDTVANHPRGSIQAVEYTAYCYGYLDYGLGGWGGVVVYLPHLASGFAAKVDLEAPRLKAPQSHRKMLGLQRRA